MYVVQVMMVCLSRVPQQPLRAIHHSVAANDTNTYTSTEGRGVGKVKRGARIEEEKMGRELKRKKNIDGGKRKRWWPQIKDKE